MNELDLFAAAISLSDPAERAALLDRECAGRPELRARLDQLLDAHFRPEPMLDRPGLDPTGDDPAAEVGDRPSGNDPVIDATLDRASPDRTRDHSASGIVIGHHRAGDERAGVVIAGKYTLVEVVGEGGMGSVWRARQTEPVKRFVAVKLIKAGMDSRQVLARFDAERQALALMDHPNIAKVLDGGLHDGRPYFVMELVKGVPITEYCDARRLTPRERLELFVPVCQAIQHAHQKGIIHRDIKPSNVLIALYDDKPVPKVIDFGVAKATGGTLTEHTIDTGFGGVVGTPQYMSPEQATFNNLDVDTRSDVYALGVLLYELLTGSPPFSKEDLEKRGVLEMLRVVREEEPPRPSTKLSTADALPSLSANRGTDPRSLTGLLRNELDWVVMKALEKDRTRRYETANGFAADVQRYLNGEPVQAHPPSTAYRLRKFVRRNRPQVIAASLVLLALVAGVVGTSLGLLEAKQQQKRAEAGENLAGERLVEVEAEKKRVEAEKKRADEERQVAQAVNDFLQKKLLAQADATAQANQLLSLGRTSAEAKLNPTIRELLDRAALELAPEKIEANFPNQPRVQAEILRTVGEAYRGVGDMAIGIPFLVRSVDLYKAKLGPDHPDTLTSMNNLALAYKDAGKLDRAIPLYEETLKLRKAKLGPDHPDTLTSMNNLALAYQDTKQLGKSLPLFEETLRLRKAKLGPDHPLTLGSMNNLALGYHAGGQLYKAVPLYEETLKRQRAKLGPDHPDTFPIMGNLAWAYRATGQLDKALPLFEETLKLETAKLGPDHPDTLTGMNGLAAGYQAAGRLDKAVPLFEEVLKMRKAKLGPDHPITLTSMNNLGQAYTAAGQIDKAVLLLEETLKLATAKYGPDNTSNLTIMNNLALCYRYSGKLDKAVPLQEETLRRQKVALGPDHPDTINSMHNLGSEYLVARQLDKAVPLLEEALRLRKAKLGPDHPDTITLMGDLGKAYCDSKQGDKAAEILTAFVALQRKRFPPGHPPFAGLLAQVSLALLDCEQFGPATDMLRESLAIREKQEPNDWRTFNTQSMLGGALLGQRKYSDAEPLLLKGYEGMKQREATIPAPAQKYLPESIGRLIELYSATNKPDEVKRWRAERAKYPEAKTEDKR